MPMPLDFPPAASKRASLALALVTSGLLCALLAPARACGDALYWTAVDDESRYTIRRSELDGSNIVDLTPGIEDSLAGLAIDDVAGKLYWVERGTTETRIIRAGLDGSDRQPIHRTSDFINYVALDSARGVVYFTASGISLDAAGVYRLTLADGEVERIVPGDIGDLEVDSPGERIYWVREGAPGEYGTDIWSAALDGSEARPVVHHSLEHHTTGIAIDSAGGKLYWATVNYREGHVQIVQRANLDGSQIEPVSSANPGLDDWPAFVELDLVHRKLYWVNGEDGVFYRVSLDGGEAEPLHEDPGPYGPFDMALLSSEDEPRLLRRGDADGDGALTVTDPIVVLGALFLGTAVPPCEDAADANDDGAIDIADAIASLGYQFLGGFTIPPPGPLECGSDPTADQLGCGAGGECGG
jgi:hypothetical protein